MAAESQLVDPGGFLKNRSIHDMETIFEDTDKGFNLSFL